MNTQETTEESLGGSFLCDRCRIKGKHATIYFQNHDECSRKNKLEYYITIVSKQMRKYKMLYLLIYYANIN
jgi:hypothetical protein